MQLTIALDTYERERERERERLWHKRSASDVKEIENENFKKDERRPARNTIV